ncbi:SDR family NAD(P)-dependent oxidoreductase [Streptomyces sp. NPDC007863]|uniref:SDR family NAD(P)-dependent oxidoreductase n=1 Tax=Streptomyces sp. NPDC007863 TaxID=3154894 RepID=UPI0033C0CEEE
MIWVSDFYSFVESLLAMHAMPDEPGRTFAGRNVVVTGAGEGAGRATARAFGESGARVALLGEGRAGLEEVAGEVRRAGGEALVVPVDMAEPWRAEEAADRVEGRLGPVVVWVNAAFASGRAPFLAAAPEEFERVTRVTYLGCVNGTRAALRRMLPRDTGAVVQLGPAPGEADGPLGAASRGASHAIDGFTASVRVELRRRRSRVAVTVVRLPAVTAPAFPWDLFRLPYRPHAARPAPSA